MILNIFQTLLKKILWTWAGKGTVKRATKNVQVCFATLLQNELNSNVAPSTTHEKKLILLQDTIERGR